MRVVVADDAVLLREGIVRILADEQYDVVAAVGSGPDLVRAARMHAPDLVVADVRMPPTHTHDGIEAVQEIRAARPGTARSCSRSTSRQRPRWTCSARTRPDSGTCSRTGSSR